MGVKKLSVKAISDAVIRIRKSKLPDPAVIGNAGSFFKNPVVSITVADHIKKSFPQIPVFEDQSGGIKLAAGWLIDLGSDHANRVGLCGIARHRRRDGHVSVAQESSLQRFGQPKGLEDHPDHVHGSQIRFHALHHDR